MKIIFKILVFLFFLVLSLIFSLWFADKSFHFFLHRSYLYTPAYYFFLLATAGCLTSLYYVILNNMSTGWIKTLFRIIIFSVGVYWIPVAIVVILIAQPYKFTGCGDEFNAAFEKAVKNNDGAFCYHLNEINMKIRYAKESATCLAPNKEPINIKDKNGIVDCISALKKARLP